MEKNEIEAYIEAGKIAKQTVDFAKSFIKPGMVLIEIAEKIEGKIEELGGNMAFPTNLSLNEAAAHYTPSSKDTTKAQGLLKIDLGVEIDGCIADTAFSLDLTDDKKYKEMIELNEKALESALNKIKQNTKIWEIGTEIDKAVAGKFSIIKNLTGHSLSENEIHAGITIPNVRNSNNTELNDIAIAIEPFLTTGEGEVYDSVPSEIYMLQSDNPVRDSESRKILKFIKEEYKTKPFCKRWLEKHFQKVDFALKIMTQQEILHNFPVLIERSRKPVSQAEHTVLILKDKVIVTTR